MRTAYHQGLVSEKFARREFGFDDDPALGAETGGQRPLAGLAQLGATFAAVGRELAKVRMPFDLDPDGAAQPERHVREELDDMDERYEQVWGRPRPSGR